MRKFDSRKISSILITNMALTKEPESKSKGKAGDLALQEESTDHIRRLPSSAKPSEGVVWPHPGPQILVRRRRQLPHGHGGASGKSK